MKIAIPSPSPISGYKRYTVETEEILETLPMIEETKFYIATVSTFQSHSNADFAGVYFKQNIINTIVEESICYVVEFLALFSGTLPYDFNSLSQEGDKEVYDACGDVLSSLVVASSKNQWKHLWISLQSNMNFNEDEVKFSH